MYLYSDKYRFGDNVYGPETGFPSGHFENAHLFQAHGRSYYDSWFIMNYLHENPEGFDYYGDDFMARLMQESSRDQNFFDMIADLAPSVSLKDTLGHFAKRMPTQDYEQQDIYQEAFENMTSDIFSYYRTFTGLRRVSDKPGWCKVPMEYAPQQTGFNIIKLNPESSNVSVEFNGLVDEQRGSDWRAAIVAEDNSGNTRYSRLFNSGRESISVSQSDEVFLIVIATPDDIMDVSAFGGEDNKPYESHPAKARFPYEVKVEGATPVEVMADTSNISGSNHPNGGGFVANSAQVAETAYVGPNAAVLDRARVLDNARIEGNALVTENAEVRDNAVVRDYAIVRGNASISNNARVLESAIVDNNTEIKDFGVAKGSAYAFGDGVVEQEGVIDGDYAGGLRVNQGNVYGWLSEKSYADSRPYEAGLYLAYDFERSNSIYALDRYGVNHGILRGSPSSNGQLRLNGRDQYVILEDNALDYSKREIEVNLSWDGGGNNQRVWSFGSSEESVMYLTPSNDQGRVEFVIRNNGREETLTGASALNVGEVVNVKVVIDGADSSLYVNNQQVASGNISITPMELRNSNISESPNQNYIGRGINDSDPYFAGEVDSFKIYNINSWYR